VACVAILRRVDVVDFTESSTEDQLILLWHPIELEHIVSRSQMFFGIPVAIQTPTHAERFLLAYNLHGVDAAVARNASDATPYVGGVIEEYIVRQVVDPDPLDRHAGGVALEDRYQLLGVGPHRFVAVHTGLARRDQSVGSHLDTGVTVAAIHPELPDVEGMAVWHRLHWLVPDIGGLGRETECNDNSGVEKATQGTDRNRGSQDPRPFWENEDIIGLVSIHENES